MGLFGKLKDKDPKKLHVPIDVDKPFGNSGLTDEMITLTKAFASIGMTQKQVAESLGVTPNQFSTWLQKYERLIDAWNAGILQRRQRAFTCYMSQAFPMEKDKKTGKMAPTNKGNPQLMIQYMRSVEGWSETNKQVIEDDRKTFEEMGREERLLRIAALEKKLSAQKDRELEEFVDE